MSCRKPVTDFYSPTFSARREGFTLLEILIALAIIGTTVTVILYTVNYHAGVMYDNTVTTLMYQLAKEQMNELEAAPVTSKGNVGTTGFSYENTFHTDEDSDFIELKTLVKGKGKEVTLTEIVLKKNYKIEK